MLVQMQAAEISHKATKARSMCPPEDGVRSKCLNPGGFRLRCIMIVADRPTKTQARLHRALDLRIKKSAPRAVVSWVRDHLRLPEADMRRIKKLYEKVMNETITAEEGAELDGLLDASAAMDLLRARVVFGAVAGRKARGR